MNVSELNAIDALSVHTISYRLNPTEKKKISNPKYIYLYICTSFLRGLPFKEGKYIFDIFRKYFYTFTKRKMYSGQL